MLEAAFDWHNSGIDVAKTLWEDGNGEFDLGELLHFLESLCTMKMAQPMKME